MWFAAMSPAYAQGWFGPFVERLLGNDPPTLRLLRHNPFRSAAAVRAGLLYLYRFTTWRELLRERAWWHRTLVGDYMPTDHTRESGIALR